MKKLTAILTACLLLGCESHDKQTKLYNAWCKVNKNSTLTQEEWQLLRDEKLLPGQVDDTAAQQAAIASGIAIGVAAGNSGGRK